MLGRQHIKCPVPGCTESFPTLKRVADHLGSVIRRNRCGAFSGQIAFNCVCGEECTTIAMVKVHAALHSKKSSLAFELPDERDEILIAEGTEDLTTNLDEDDCFTTSNNEVQFVSATGEDDVTDLHPLDTMFLDIDPDGDGERYEGEDDDEDDFMADEMEFPNDSLCSTLNKAWLLPGSFDIHDQDKMQLYRYCLDSRITVKGYRQLRQLRALTDSSFPLNLKDLRGQVESILENKFLWPKDRTSPLVWDEGKRVVPFLTVGDCLSIWLSVPSILDAVRTCRVDHLPFDLLDETEYEAILLSRQNDMESSDYAYKAVADGSWYIIALRNAVPLFREQYLKAVSDGIEIIVCNVGLYEDDFSKNLNSLVSQTIYSLTLVEATVGLASLTKLESIIVMLSESSDTKSHGDALRKTFVDELRNYERGVRMLVNGNECLVICLSLLLLGDTPALKVMCGLSSSVSSACYVRQPCMICDIKMEHLAASIAHPVLLGSMRRSSIVKGFYMANGGVTGNPSAAWLREMMKQHGFTRISELVRLNNHPSSEAMGLDTMHAILRGVLVRHFTKTVKILTTGTGLRLDRGVVWKKISSEFGAYCRSNRISAYCAFTCKKEFKMRMTAGSIREFAKVSMYILRKIGLVPSCPSTRNVLVIDSWKRRIECFNYWCLHAKIAYLLDQHSIAVPEMSALEILITKLLVYFKRVFSDKFITINVHYYLHFVEKIKFLGPLRIVANNSREHLIQMLKPYYRNTNHSRKEVSVFRRYKTGLFFKVHDILLGNNPMQYEINYVPLGYDIFRFDNYKTVILVTPDICEALPQHRFKDIPVFVFNSKKGTTYKINYTMVRPGDYIYLSSGFLQGKPHIGRLVSVLQLDGIAYISYVTPTSCVDAPLTYLFYQTSKVKRESLCDTLYVVPLSQFLARLYSYAYDAENDAIIFS